MKLIILIVFLCSAPLFANEKSLYNFGWLDPDKEVYVLQNRKFRKSERFYVGANGVKTLSGAFVDSFGGSVRAGYFFKEDWGIEFAFGKNSGSENNTAKGVKESGTTPYYRKIDKYSGAMLVWSPFYSKINTFNKIFYFDWMFGLGAAQITSQHNGNELDPASLALSKLTSEDKMGLLWNTGLRIYLNERWSLRFDISGLHYNAEKTRILENSTSSSKAESLFSAYDLGIGLNFTL